MQRLSFFKTVAKASLTVLAANSLSAFKQPEEQPDIDRLPTHLNPLAPDFDKVRDDFPRVRDEVYMDNASTHPINIYTAAALHRYTEWAKNNVGEPWWPGWTDSRDACKKQFAQLVNADQDEIAFARSTVEAENNILNGMDLKGGNVVTTDLHYSASLYSYKMREMRDGLKVHVIRHNDWRFDVKDFEKVVNKKTKLIAITLVSNVNGFLVTDLRAISDLAHANGAILYVDIIQGVGNVPVDVRAMGIDVAACSTFKWLMGSKGFGFLYVRRDLQDTVVKTTHHNGGVHFNYSPWTDQADPSKPDIDFTPRTGAGIYEVSYPSYEGVICAQAALKYISELGVANIRQYVRTLTKKLSAEMPRLGYPSITPEGNDSPIVVFTVKTPDATMRKLRQANIHVAMRFGNKLRISPSIYNNNSDIEKLLGVLS
ncbi:MAG: aminotransferase class V-fold PLP-dependent enzyme [Chitinophagaceae bacterium]|nr:aminotransferase class V-fold PLP-dependent enzyme [Chitinophagaceae bacterium]